MAEEKDYDVGYKKPPRHTRFSPGESGNPKGRPKGARNFKTDLAAVLKERVSVNQNGRKRSVSTQLAGLMRLREKALKGDAKALDRLLSLAQTYNSDDQQASRETVLPDDDQAVLDAFIKRRTRQKRVRIYPVRKTGQAKDPGRAAGDNTESDKGDRRCRPY